MAAPGVARIFAHRSLGLPRSVESAPGCGSAVAITPRDPQFSARIDRGFRDIRPAVRDRSCLLHFEPCPVATESSTSRRGALTPPGRACRRDQRSKWGGRILLDAWRPSIRAGDEQLLLLALIADPGGPGVRQVRTRRQETHAVTRGQVQGRGHALDLDAAVEKFQRSPSFASAGRKLNLLAPPDRAPAPIPKSHKGRSGPAPSESSCLWERYAAPRATSTSIEHSGEARRAGPGVVGAQLVLLSKCQGASDTTRPPLVSTDPLQSAGA